MLKGLYGITDQQQSTERLLSAVKMALFGGVRLIQYRNKSSDLSTRLIESKQLLNLCHDYSCPLIINDDLQLAHDIEADGVHLGQNDGSIREARKTLGHQAIIGATCHDSLELAQQAQQDGASYVAFGRFFPSVNKPYAATAPINILQQAREVLQIPIVAIGGINLHNASQVIEAGADMIAVIEGLFGAADIQDQAHQFQQLFMQE